MSVVSQGSLSGLLLFSCAFCRLFSCLFGSINPSRLEWLDQVLVHPSADIERSIVTVLNRQEGMATTRVVV